MSYFRNPWLGYWNEHPALNAYKLPDYLVAAPHAEPKKIENGKILTVEPSKRPLKKIAKLCFQTRAKDECRPLLHDLLLQHYRAYEMAVEECSRRCMSKEVLPGEDVLVVISLRVLLKHERDGSGYLQWFNNGVSFARVLEKDEVQDFKRTSRSYRFFEIFRLRRRKQDTAVVWWKSSTSPPKTKKARLERLRMIAVLLSISVDALRLVLFSLRLLGASTDSELAFRVEIAEACAAATTNKTERYLCMKIPRFESLYRVDVGRCEVKDKAGELTAWQILPRGAKDTERLCKTVAEDAKVAIDRIRESRAACRHLPTEEQLSLYTRGSCESEEGRKLSRARWPYDKEVGP